MLAESGDLICSRQVWTVPGPVPKGVLEVPDFMLKKPGSVRATMRKVMTRVIRGERLGEVLDEFPLVDLATQPGAVLMQWMRPRHGYLVDRDAVAISVAGVSDGFWLEERIDIRELSRLRDEQALDYFATRPWGGLVLNCDDGQWTQNFPGNATPPINPDHVVTVLEATLRYWDTYLRLGRRFHGLATVGIEEFARADPHSATLVRACGINVNTFEPVTDEMLREAPNLKRYHVYNVGAGALPQLCEEHRVLERLRDDANFREGVSYGAFFKLAREREFQAIAAVQREIAPVDSKARYYNPELYQVEHAEDDDAARWELLKENRATRPPALMPGNLEEVVRLCAIGEGEPDRWDFIKSHGGEAAVERALAGLEQSGNWHALLIALVHEVEDFDRATTVVLKYSKMGSELEWVRDELVEYWEDKDPDRAIELMMQEAEFYVNQDKPEFRRACVAKLWLVHRLLKKEGRTSDWDKLIARFKATHRDRKTLLQAVKKKGL